jgi:hypothetical protein
VRAMQIRQMHSTGFVSFDDRRWPITAPSQCDVCPLLCRFSDAGNDELSTRSGGRRSKSAKARNRVRRQWEGGAAGERRSKKAMEIWSPDRASGDLGRSSESNRDTT